MEHLQSEEPFSSDPYFSVSVNKDNKAYVIILGNKVLLNLGNNTGPNSWYTQQASSINLRHETTLLSTPLLFWPVVLP